MSEHSYQDTIDQINRAQTQLKIRLKEVSRLRLDCARLQLELLKLYKPQCLEILEALRDFTASSFDRHNDDNPMYDELHRHNTEAYSIMERGYQINSLFEQSSIETSDPLRQPIEMQENAPIFYRDSTIVTTQPEAADTRSHRRPIPVNTLDWVSTPRSQLNALSGTQFLAGVDQLEIQQIIDLSTLLGRTDKGNQYRVKVPRAETLFLAMESMSQRESRMFGWYKGFVLNVLDQCGETAFVIRKEPSWLHVPGSSQKITVESADFIGSVEKNCSVIGPSFTVYDAFRKPLCNIYGPNICACCMYKEAQFQIVSIDGTHQIASLMHHWDHLSVDYILLLAFPIETDVKLKSLLLGASFLIEYLYFQRVRRASRS